MITSLHAINFHPLPFRLIVDGCGIDGRDGIARFGGHGVFLIFSGEDDPEILV